MKLLSLAIFAVATLFGTIHAQCPADFPHQFGPNCYRFVGDGPPGEQLMPFAGAQTDCQNRGGKLAEIISSDQNDYLMGLINSLSLPCVGSGGPVTGPGSGMGECPFLIGYTSVGFGGFRLASSGAILPPGVEDFGAGTMPTGGQQCTTLVQQNDDWVGADCTVDSYYICERQLASVECDVPANDIVFSINVAFLSNFDIVNDADLHIGPNNVAGCQVTRVLNGPGDADDVYTATIGPNDCGTMPSYLTTEPDAIVLRNTLNHSPSGDVITRSLGELLAFQCRAQAIDLLSSPQIDPQALVALLTQTGFGDFDVSLRFTDVDYLNPSAAAQSVTLGQPVYLQVRVSSALSNLDVYADECYASPSANPNDLGNIVTVIDNDCPGEERAQASIGAALGLTDFNFEFNAFQFIVAGNPQPFVFIHCNTNICLDTVAGTLCDSAACPARRRRREVALISRWKRQSPVAGFSPGTSPEQQLTTLGPLAFNVDGLTGGSSAGAAYVQPTFYGMLLSMGLLYLAQ
ncbi:uncharacterized protein LOC135829542 [Sycon ciliatum]|uniref:uncharacterized protein LOC135829542 n=1 Tax=Sycon ciliatum TaxID=27933 RepID=UPI0031F5FDDE